MPGLTHKRARRAGCVVASYVGVGEFLARLGAALDMATEVAEEALPAVRAALASTADARTAPDGTPWAPTKQGAPALPGASRAIGVSLAGRTFIVTLDELRWIAHNFGAGGSSQSSEAIKARKRRDGERASGQRAASRFHAPKRQIIPHTGEPLPEGVRKALEDAAKTVAARRGAK